MSNIQRYIRNPEVLSDDEIEYQRLKRLAMQRIADYASVQYEAVDLMNNHAAFMNHVASEIEELARRISG